MLFPVWALAMGAGVWMSQWAVWSLWWTVAAMVIAVIVLCLLLRRKNHWWFLGVSCAFFVLLGLLRGETGDWSLMPQSWAAAAESMADWTQRRLHSIGCDEEVTGLLDAMMLGRREGLGADLRTLYANVGSSHILALSGLHMSVIVGILNLWAIRFVAKPSVRLVLALAAIAVLWFYVMMTGAPTSVVRSAIMMSIVVISHARWGESSSWNALGQAAMCILFVAPSELWGVSFQLSVASVAGILAFCPAMDRAVTIYNPTLHALWSGVLCSLGAQVGSFPLVAYYFHYMSPYAFIFSIVYVALATFILYGGLLSLLAGHLMAVPMTLLVGAQHGLMRLVADFPLAVVDGLYPSACVVALVYMALAGCAIVMSDASKSDF